MADAVQNLTFTQTAIKVSVEFYDEEEREKLMAYPTAFSMQSLVENGLTILVSEFLTYYLFHRKSPGKAGWTTFTEIRQHVGTSVSHLNDFIDFNGESISNPTNVGTQDRHITEHVGESIGLSVISAIHGLTEADWDPLEIRGGPKGVPSFDFDIAADSKNVIQVETKGSSTDDNEYKTTSVSNHKRAIKEKKEAIDELGKDQLYPYPANLRYGTIVVIGENPASPVKCLLVDPPAEGDARLARRIKILNRLRFMRDWITFISPRSQLASALQTRVASVERIIEPDVLTGLPLLRGNGKPFSFEPVGYSLHSSFFANKSRISDGPAGGVCVLLDGDRLLFLGVRDEFLQDASNQDFAILAEKRYQSASLRKTVECVFSAGRFRNLELPRNLLERAYSREGYVQFDLSGTIHYSSSGILFGILPFA